MIAFVLYTTEYIELNQKTSHVQKMFVHSIFKI